MDNLDLNEDNVSVTAVRDDVVSDGGVGTVFDMTEMKLPLRDEKEENVTLMAGDDMKQEPEEDIFDESSDELKNVLENLGDEFGKIKYLSNEQNLDIPPVNGDMVDEDAPFDSLKTAGKWLREAMNLKNYWQGIERFGEDVARYKWAYDQGEMGEFDGKTFAGEAMKAGIRSVGRDTLRTAGNMLSMFGANLSRRSIPTTIMTSGAGLMMPEVGEVYQKIGETFRAYADEVENIDFFAAADATYDEDPSWNKLANVIGSGAAQVLAMGGMARLIGAGATYGLFAGGSAGEIFNEALQQDGDVGKANTLAAMNAGVSFAIDKLFDPLPETVAKNAKLTSKKVVEEMFGAPLREAGAEVLQQMLAENLVRQVGIDDTADLFEGLVESALGAFAGSSVLTSSTGAVYLARKNLDDVRRRIMLKGVSAEELDLYQNNMMALIETRPEAFEKILGANLKENLKQMDLAARQIKNRQERAKKRGDIKAFDAVYEEMYQRFSDVLGDDVKAKAAAKMFEANALSLYKWDNSLSPQKLLEGLLPKVEKTDVAGFLARQIPEEAVSYSLIGVNAKHANMNRLTTALELEKMGAEEQFIWQKTGWHRGGDGKWRMEISDKDATIKLWDNTQVRSEMQRFFDESRHQVKTAQAYLAASLRKSTEEKYGAFYLDFYDYLLKNAKGKFAIKRGLPTDEITTQNVLELLNSVDRKKRVAERIVLDDVMRRYRETYVENQEKATLKDALEELEKHHGKTFDFSQEEYKYVMGMLNHNFKQDFSKRYWDETKNALRRDDFQEMAENGDFEYGESEGFVEELSAVAQKAEERREERLNELKRLNVEPTSFFFTDIDHDEAYEAYRVYQGDFGADKLLDGGDDFLPQSYKNAFAPMNLAEKFLAQEKYDYMKKEEKQDLIKYLKRIERMHRLREYLTDTDVFENMGALLKKDRDIFGSDQGESDGIRLQRALQERLLGRMRKNVILADILEHPQLFENYPEVAAMEVHFGTLTDQAPYHYYFDQEKGYVLEVDPLQINNGNLKEVLLRAATFVVQDIEGFDYTLTSEQRRNFMNRQIILAARKTEPAVVGNLELFVDKFLPETDYHQFLSRQLMPLPLMKLAESVDLKNIDRSRRIRSSVFWEVNYGKLMQAVQEKYQYPQSVEGYPLRNLAYMELQNLKNRNTSMIMAAARVGGGYSSILMPWAGITSQGMMDERALVSRMDLSEEELKKKPFFDNVKFDSLTGQDSLGEGYQTDTIDTYDEFAAKIAKDAKDYRETLTFLADGAYNRFDRTISLFEKGNAETIVHETFHYFWELMQMVESKRESHGADFRDMMGELREEFAKLYRVKEHDGKWFAVDKETGKRPEELRRGFDTQEDAVNAGVRELFVTHFMAMLNNRVYSRNEGHFGRVARFYRDWLLTVTDTLGISDENMTPDGVRLLKFLIQKVK